MFLISDKFRQAPDRLAPSPVSKSLTSEEKMGSAEGLVMWPGGRSERGSWVGMPPNLVWRQPRCTRAMVGVVMDVVEVVVVEEMGEVDTRWRSGPARCPGARQTVHDAEARHPVALRAHRMQEAIVRRQQLEGTI